MKEPITLSDSWIVFHRVQLLIEQKDTSERDRLLRLAETEK